MDLLRSRLLQHRDDLSRGVAPDDRVVDHHHALARDDLRQWVELHPEPVLPQLLTRLNERPRHVAVLDQAVVLRQARGPREPVGHRIAGVRYRDDQIRIHRGLLGQQLTHPASDLLEYPVLEPGVGAREVDVLEDAVRRLLPGDHRLQLETPACQRDQLTGLHLADHLRTDDVEGAALGGDHEAFAEVVVRLDLAERQRPHPMRVAEGDNRVLGHHHRGVGPLEPRHHLGDRVLDPLLALTGRPGEQRRHDLRVRGPAQLHSGLGELVVELDRVGQVAVVGERQLPAVVPPDGLRVLPRAAAGGRVANVADRHVAGERPKFLLIEDLRDEPQLAHRGDVSALAGGDPRRLLPAVLERVQPEIAETGYVPAGCVYAEDPAFIARAIAIRNVETPVGHVCGRYLNLWRSNGRAGTQPAPGG